MKRTLQSLYLTVLVFIFLICNAATSFILFFIPRSLRRKKDIKGHRVLITGAGSGVGRELAIEFSKHATCLILVDINKQSLLQTEKLLDRCSPVFVYECDVSDYRKVYEMAKQVKKDAGDVDILVNNAGIVCGKFFWDLPEEKIVKTMEVNALAHFWTCKAFLPAMMEKNRGHIVNILSLVSKVAVPRLTDYCASKYAALGFAESLEMELRLKELDGVKITTVCPTHIDTGLFKGANVKVGPMLTPEYVAKEIVAGVLVDEEMIYIPFYLKPYLILNQCGSRWISIEMSKKLGLIHAMDNFVGREPSENGTNIKIMPKKRE